ncbi:MAG: hypothetical protein DMG01_27410 [Acidobacteria bacterium]|nr:MAG: hypothetical protein DMG01_27410 [Acidobacteriota bacterium]
MGSSPFGSAPTDLHPGARNAVEVCLAIAPGERVALIGDLASAEVAASLAGALDEAGARTDALVLERLAERPMRQAPAAVVAALERADVGILCVQPHASSATRT